MNDEFRKLARDNYWVRIDMARSGDAAQQGDEADEAWSTSELRSLSPVFDRLPAGQHNGTDYGLRARLDSLQARRSEPCGLSRRRRFRWRGMAPAELASTVAGAAPPPAGWAESAERLCIASRIHAHKQTVMATQGKLSVALSRQRKLGHTPGASGEFGRERKTGRRHTLSNKWMQQTRSAPWPAGGAALAADPCVGPTIGGRAADDRAVARGSQTCSMHRMSWREAPRQCGSSTIA